MILNSPGNWNVHYEYHRGGLGQVDAVTNVTQGLTDFFSNLTPGEWAVLLGGAYIFYSVFFTTKAAASTVQGYRRKRAARRRRELEQAMESL